MSRADPAEAITHVLVVDQPWAWAILAGHIGVANVERIPSADLVGTRIAIGAERMDWNGPKLLESMGVDLGRKEGLIPVVCWQFGVLGSAVLEGWVRHDGGGKIAETHRPGSTVPFRSLKGLSGQIGWVLRKPRKLQGEIVAFKRIRARWEETTQATEELLRYAREHGTDGLSPWHLGRLDALGFRKVKGKQ